MDTTLAEIRLFAGNFTPQTWALCQGQLMSINSNQALYSLLGNTYGGDGNTTFQLPDFRGRTAVGTNQGASPGPGLNPVYLGQPLGNETTMLSVANLPSHNHIASGPGTYPISGNITAKMNVNNTAGTISSPAGNFAGTEQSGSGIYATSPSTTSSITDTLNSNAITVDTSQLSANVGSIQLSLSGQGSPLDNMQPYLALNYIIGTEGIYPSRN